MRKTKIVCTLGPATDSLDMLKSLLEAGMDVARLNFSHGNHEEHHRRIGLCLLYTSPASASRRWSPCPTIWSSPPP